MNTNFSKRSQLNWRLDKPSYQMTVWVVSSKNRWFNHLTAISNDSNSHNTLSKNLFYINSNGDKFYKKVVDFYEIYNFVVQNCFISYHLCAQRANIMFRSMNRRNYSSLDNTSSKHHNYLIWTRVKINCIQNL